MKRAVLAVLLVLSPLSAQSAMSKAETRKVITEHGLPDAVDGMLAVLNTSMETAPKVVEPYLTLGVPAEKEIICQTSETRPSGAIH